MRKPTHQPEAGVHGQEDEGRFGPCDFIQLREYAVKAKAAPSRKFAALAICLCPFCEMTGEKHWIKQLDVPEVN